jgi:DNA-binding NarL/FixJ family response regulator
MNMGYLWEISRFEMRGWSSLAGILADPQSVTRILAAVDSHESDLHAVPWKFQTSDSERDYVGKVLLVVPQAQGRADKVVRQSLVVEDNQAFGSMIVSALSELDVALSPLLLETGADALVAIDLGLPDMNGVEVKRAARRRFPGAPILVISVFFSNESVLGAIRAGACGYIHKGDLALSMANAIRRVLEGAYPISPSLARFLFNLVETEGPEVESRLVTLTSRKLELLKLLGRGLPMREPRCDCTSPCRPCSRTSNASIKSWKWIRKPRPLPRLMPWAGFEASHTFAGSYRESHQGVAGKSRRDA